MRSPMLNELAQTSCIVHLVESASSRVAVDIVLVSTHQTASLARSLRMGLYSSEYCPISQNISVGFRTTRKDSTGHLMGEHE